jgi:hypothetical protein
LQRIQIKQSKMSQEHLTKLVEELYFAFHGNTILILILFLFILNLISFFHVNSFFLHLKYTNHLKILYFEIPLTILSLLH